jgi:hypothetical protein
MPWGFFDGNLSAVKVLHGLVCVLPPFLFVFLDGCCETPFSLGGEAANFGRVLCAFGLAGALAQGQGFLVNPRSRALFIWALVSLDLL